MNALAGLYEKIKLHPKITLAKVAAHCRDGGSDGESIKWLRDRMNGNKQATHDEQMSIWKAWDLLHAKGLYTAATLSTETGSR